MTEELAEAPEAPEAAEAAEKAEEPAAAEETPAAEVKEEAAESAGEIAEKFEQAPDKVEELFSEDSLYFVSKKSLIADADAFGNEITVYALLTALDGTVIETEHTVFTVELP